ncbi:hypothetical protein ILUMI_21122 [Ignelater luminosus]|uniref:Uncharacterized protein n=1 Tax=Ignelater luminosus TaxID=2038154 RepID=A0A8K0CJH4_IGNLU|nr:hypothetical protein ILUMI_21122 [Ignelater luminosus]
MTARNVRCLAYQLSDKNGIKHPFSKSKQAAGSPEATSVARARAFNKPVVTKFYILLKVEVIKKKIPAHCIFNVNETFLNTVLGKDSKVVVQTGRKQVARITSAERGLTTTAVI